MNELGMERAVVVGKFEKTEIRGESDAAGDER
jgi:hypothetical protein